MDYQRFRVWTHNKGIVEIIAKDRETAIRIANKRGICNYELPKVYIRFRYNPAYPRTF